MANSSLFGLYFGGKYNHSNRDAKSIARPVHSYYFSKAPTRKGLGWERVEGLHVFSLILYL